MAVWEVVWKVLDETDNLQKPNPPSLPFSNILWKSKIPFLKLLLFALLRLCVRKIHTFIQQRQKIKVFAEVIYTPQL